MEKNHAEASKSDRALTGQWLTDIGSEKNDVGVAQSSSARKPDDTHISLRPTHLLHLKRFKYSRDFMLLQSRRSFQPPEEQLHPFVLKPEYLTLVVSCLPLYCGMGVGGENDKIFL